MSLKTMIRSRLLFRSTKAMKLLPSILRDCKEKTHIIPNGRLRER